MLATKKWFHFFLFLLYQLMSIAYSLNISYSKNINHAKVARSLVYKSNWTAAGTISTDQNLQGFPMVNIVSISDNEPSDGDIYFMMTDLDFTSKDVMKKNVITFLLSNDEDLSCSKNNGIDPMAPICARVIISGSVQKIGRKTKEYITGFNAYVMRHPAVIQWMKVHDFFLCKLKIINIYVLDSYGGAHNVLVDDYYKAM